MTSLRCRGNNSLSSVPCARNANQCSCSLQRCSALCMVAMALKETYPRPTAYVPYGSTVTIHMFAPTLVQHRKTRRDGQFYRKLGRSRGLADCSYATKTGRDKSMLPLIYAQPWRVKSVAPFSEQYSLQCSYLRALLTLCLLSATTSELLNLTFLMFHLCHRVLHFFLNVSTGQVFSVSNCM